MSQVFEMKYLLCGTGLSLHVSDIQRVVKPTIKHSPPNRKYNSFLESASSMSSFFYSAFCWWTQKKWPRMRKQKFYYFFLHSRLIRFSKVFDFHFIFSRLGRALPIVGWNCWRSRRKVKKILSCLTLSSLSHLALVDVVTRNWKPTRRLKMGKKRAKVNCWDYYRLQSAVQSIAG